MCRKIRYRGITNSRRSSARRLSADNNEYLTKTFSANDNKLGAIFMDMRNQNDFSDRNTFIYGHNMKVGGEMFSQLNEYASEDFYKAHPYFYIYTPDGKTRTE